MERIVFSEIIILKLVLVGLLLYLGMRLLKFLWKNVPMRRALKMRFSRFIPIVEGLIWLGYLLWCIRQLVRDDLWSSLGVLLVVLLVMALLFWFFVRDFLAGIALKSDGSLRLNDWVKIKDVEGKITRMGTRTMIVTTHAGETVNIPYSALSGEISIKSNPTEKLQSHSFELMVPKTRELESTIETTRRTILNAPWSSVRKKPEIKLLRDTPSHYYFEINIYSIKQIYFPKIKEYLKSGLGLEV